MAQTIFARSHSFSSECSTVLSRTRSWSSSRLFKSNTSGMEIPDELVSFNNDVRHLQWSFFPAFAFGVPIAQVCEQRKLITPQDVNDIHIMESSLEVLQKNFNRLYTLQHHSLNTVDFDFTPAPDCFRFPSRVYWERNQKPSKEQTKWLSTWLNNDLVHDHLLTDQMHHFVSVVETTARYIHGTSNKNMTFRLTGEYGSRSKPTIERIMRKCARRGVTLVFAGQWILPRGEAMGVAPEAMGAAPEATHELDAKPAEPIKRRGVRGRIRHRINQYKFVKAFM